MKRQLLYAAQSEKCVIASFVFFFLFSLCGNAELRSPVAMCDWRGTEPDSRQKQAGPTRRGRSAIRGCSEGTGQPAAAPLCEQSAGCGVGRIGGGGASAFNFGTQDWSCHWNLGGDHALLHEIHENSQHAWEPPLYTPPQYPLLLKKKEKKKKTV